jgi:hypothetical protein
MWLFIILFGLNQWLKRIKNYDTLHTGISFAVNSNNSPGTKNNRNYLSLRRHHVHFILLPTHMILHLRKYEWAYNFLFLLHI